MWFDERLDSGKRCTGCGAWVAGRPEVQLTCRTAARPYARTTRCDSRADCSEHAYSFGAYLRSRFGFAFGMIALMAVVAGILAVTGSNASAIALVSICEALFICIVLAAGFLRDRRFYQQLDLFCNSPENARYLSRFWTSRELWKALSPITGLLYRARRLPTNLPPALAT